MEPISLGIISSLIATFIFLTLSKVFTKIVLPWFENKIYRGVRIDGQWVVTMSNGEAIEDTDWIFNIRQWGDKIEGTYGHTITSGGTKKREAYNLSGHFRDGYLSGILTPIARDEIDAGAFVFKIRGSGFSLQLDGEIIAIDTMDNTIDSYPLTITKH